MEQLTEIPAYAFAGQEDLEEVEIPAGTKKIGRYAFYNCRNLKKFIFHSDIIDLGAGVFTGCHRIRCLEMTLVHGAPSILKEILMELDQQLLVIVHGEEEIRLWFPEYFEEGVENTPARILENHVHGSGLLYRNCFAKTRLRYEEYDERFPYVCASESEDFSTRLAFDRLAFPYELSPSAKERYLTHCRENEEEVQRYLSGMRDMYRLRKYLGIFDPDRERMQKLIDRMRQDGFFEAVPLLMNYYQEHFGGKRRSFSL